MRRRDKAGGKTIKTPRRKTLKRLKASKIARRRKSTATGKGTNVERLARELARVVTDQKQLTQELLRREAYLAEAQRLSHTGSFDWKPDTGEIVWSDETYCIFEYDRSVKPTIDSVVQRVHPQDRADLQKVIADASRGATDFEHTYRLLLPDGRVKHVHALGRALQDASGNREFAGGGD
jgi:PAS domain-containing protein